MIGGSIGLSFAVAIVSAPVIFRWVGMPGMFTAIGVLAIVAIGVVLWVVPNAPRPPEHVKAPFREVLRRLGVEPSESLMIGDWAERDVVGARSLGMRTVFARYGDTFDTKESGADFDVDDVFELVSIVDRLNDRRDTPSS